MMNNSSRNNNSSRRGHPLRLGNGSYRCHHGGMNNSGCGDHDCTTCNQDEVAEITLTQEEEEEVKEVKRMAQSDTKRVQVWRFAALFVLLVTAFAVTYTTYRLLKKEERDNFETAFEQFSRTVGDSAIHQQQDLRNGLASLATSIAVYAQSNEHNDSFPFVTLPRFELYAHHALKQAHMETINFLPLVKNDQRYDWVNYSKSHYQGWVKEGHLLQKGNLERLVGDESTYHPFVSRREPDGSFQNETEQNEYFVSWMYSPPPATYDLINGNLFSVPQFATAGRALLELGSETLITNVFKHVGIPTAMTHEEHNKMHSKLLDTRSENPHSFVVHPIHRAPNPLVGEEETEEIVGVLAGAFAWDVALLNLLPDGVVGIHAVIRNNCDQSYTYDIRGSDAMFLGPDDLHESEYQDYEVVVNLALHSHPDFSTTPGHCQYTMHIYPSEEFRASYDSNTPELFALVVAITFLVVAIVFFVYDLFVQRRNHNLIVKAAQTNAIVYSLFPNKEEEVKDGQEAKAGEETDTSSHQSPIGAIPATSTTTPKQGHRGDVRDSPV